jgi:DNA-binding SARP family transcriptional activator/class 3 adenylate cyclase
VASRRTVSVLFTDVVGSTELRGALGDDRADDVFARLCEDQVAAVQENRGTLVKSLGDGIMAVFDSAADAVAAGAQIQSRTTERARLEDVDLAARVGVSAGDASLESGDWFGTPVVEASRLCAAATAGQVLVADLVRSLAGSRTHIAFLRLGPMTLKGLADEVVAYEIEADGAATAPAARTVRRTDDNALRLRLAGPFTVERGGEAVPDADLGSRKARLLLKVLAARRGHIVPMDEIVEVLWGADAPAKAEANVATLVSRLRGVLGSEVVDGGRSGYRVAVSASVVIDLDEAEQLVSEASARLAAGQPALALTAARRATALLGRGTVLDDEPGADWTADAARQAQRLVRHARAATWAACAEFGDHRASLAAAQDAVATDALDEEAHRAVMSAYYRAGEPGEALAAYERLRTVLVEELGADPGPESEALYTAILRGERVADTGRAARGKDGDDDSDFVGRADELDALLAIWSQASQGASACVLISGESGIGKSRLASELAARASAAGALVLHARCFEAERSLFLQPIIEVVRAAVGSVAPEIVRRAAGDRAGTLAALVPEIGQILRPIGYEPASLEIERRRTFEAVAEFLGRLAAVQPLLVVLDDLHETGASTVELLHFSLRWDRHAPLLVVATARTGEAGDATDGLRPVATTIELAPLSEDAVRALARRAGLGAHAEAIQAMTRGHTLFVLEALRALGDAGGAEVGGALPIPTSLRDAIVARARRGGEDVDELLRAAVVIGASFELDVLAELLSTTTEEVARRADRATRAGLLRESGAGYEFANDVIRDVLYETTPRPVRVVRHRRLVTMLAGHPEAAASHAAAAGEWKEAITCWCEAARRASKAFANREADDLLTSALNAASMVDEPALTAEAQLERGKVRLAQGRYAAAAEDLSAAHQLARAVGESAIEVTALTELGWSAYHARDAARSRELAARAAAHPASDPRARILVGRICNTDGDLDGAFAALEPETEATDPAARALALSCLGTALTHTDRYAEAIATIDEALGACHRTGSLRGLLNARAFGAIARANLGQFGEALAWAEQLLRDCDRFEAPFYRPRAFNSLAWIWRELGDNGKATEFAMEAMTTSVGVDGSIEGEPAAHALLAVAESALLDGDAAAAVGRLGELDALLAGHVAFGWRIALRRLELLSRVEAQRAEELLEQARHFGSAKYEALALGRLGAVEEAVATAERTGSNWLLARVCPPDLARRLVDDIAARLPDDLREAFATHGALTQRLRH